MSEVKKFIIGGVLWAIITAPIIFSDTVREFFYQKFGHGIEFFFLVSPIAWTLFFTEKRIIAILLTPVMGGLLGYFVYLFKKMSQVPPKP